MLYGGGYVSFCITNRFYYGGWQLRGAVTFLLCAEFNECI